MEKKTVSFKRSLTIGLIGNVLEWYDFTVYAFFAETISVNFFPGQSQINGLIKVFAVFAIGFLARPIGSVLFGQIGDRFGRSTALQISILAMGAPSFLIGIIPSYQHIGILAPILLLFLRIIQGLSAGGELVGSAAYIYEMAPPGKECFWSSWVSSSCMTGVLFGSLCSVFLHYIAGKNINEAWVWRSPFLLGIFITGFGFLMRKQMVETFSGNKNRSGGLDPIISVFKNSRAGVVKVGLINIFVSIAFYILFVWFPSYYQFFLHISAKEAIFVNTIAMVSLVAFTPVAGFIADCIGAKKVALFSPISITIIVIPCFVFLQNFNSMADLIIVQLCFAFCLSAIDGVLPWIMANSFPIEARCSGAGISYNLSTSLFGGTAPLLCTFFISKMSMPIFPGFYLILASLVALPGFLMVKNGGEKFLYGGERNETGVTNENEIV